MTAHAGPKSATVACVTAPVTQAMLTDTDAEAVPPRPSPIVYVNVSAPQAPGFGVYVIVWFAFTTAVPFVPEVTDATTRGSLSGSLSFASTPATTGEPSSVLT